MDSKFNSKFSKQVYKEAFNSQDWKYTRPVLDYTRMFKYVDMGLNAYNAEVQDDWHVLAFADTVNKDIDNNIKLQKIVEEAFARYPHSGLPPRTGLFIYTQYYYAEHLKRHLSWAERTKPIHPNMLLGFERYLANKIADDPGFPFRALFTIEAQLICETEFGIKMFLHDIFQPVSFKARVPGLSRTDLIRTCPTVVYEKPEDICKTFPVSFLIICPFFIYPRTVNPVYGLGENALKMSLFDVFATEYYETRVNRFGRNSMVPILYANQKALLEDFLHPDLMAASVKWLRRELLVNNACPPDEQAMQSLTQFVLQQSSIKKRRRSLELPTLDVALFEAQSLDGHEMHRAEIEKHLQGEVELLQKVKSLKDEVRI